MNKSLRASYYIISGSYGGERERGRERERDINTYIYIHIYCDWKMEKRMEGAVLDRGCIGGIYWWIMQKKTEPTKLYWGYILV